MQPQGHVQVVRGLADGGLSPDRALAFPRWHWSDGVALQLEAAWDETVTTELSRRGHEVTRVSDLGLFGRGQIILRDGGGTYTAAGDPRADSLALAY
jgi:gamma-glutamyltranspeptidase/glutathione hydrolase